MTAPLRSPRARRVRTTPPWMRSKAWPFVFIGLHAPLALGLRVLGSAALLYPLGVTALALYWAHKGRADRAIYATGYLAGAEVLWRMNQAAPLWEYGKYAIVLVLAYLAIRVPTRLPFPWQGAAYLALLVPSCLLTVQALGMGDETMDALSFNLSGPLALAVSVLVLARYAVGVHVRLDRLCLAILAPACGVAALAAWSVLTAGTVEFSGQSNFVASGGYGPNQVSAVLGLAAFLAFVLGIHSAEGKVRFLFLALSMGLLTQALLTLSRGGVLNSLIAIAAISLHSLRQPRVRATLLVLLSAFVLIGLQVVTPALDQWTGGALSQRYSDLDTSGRSQIIESDVQLWRDHPLLGVGPGMAKFERDLYLYRQVAPHTEYTRLIAEHGLFGAVALLLLLLLLMRRYWQAPHPLARGWIAALVLWSLAEMTHSAMRIAAISLLFGLATLYWAPPGKSPRPGPPTPKPTP